MTTLVMHVPDLMFGTRIEDAAKRLGFEIRVLDSADQADAIFEHFPSSLLIASLDAPEWKSVVESAKRRDARVLAFGSHKDAQALRAARAAGCDDVVVRSQMAADLHALLKKYAK